MKKLVREFEFQPQEASVVQDLAYALALTETTAGILYARGMDTVEKMRAFLRPSREHFLSPFLMSGMREAVELIRRVRFCSVRCRSTGSMLIPLFPNARKVTG